MNCAAALYTRVWRLVSVAATVANSAWRKESPRETYLPLAFISIAGAQGHRFTRDNGRRWFYFRFFFFFFKHVGSTFSSRGAHAAWVD